MFPKLKRPRFFDGKLLNIQDLEVEQQYFINRMKLHNRYLHGYGVVCGLKVSLSDDIHPAVIVSPGYALDAAGNDLLVSTSQRGPLPDVVDERVAYLCIRWVEHETDFLPVPADATGSLDPTEASAIEEQVLLEYESSCPASKKRKPCEEEIGCGEQHGIALARLVKANGLWKIDKCFRVQQVRTGK